MEKGSLLELKVADMNKRDTWRGIVRLDPKDMMARGIRTGDVVALTGKKKTAVKAMPTFPSERGRTLIQLDALTRFNAGVEIGDTVSIEPVQIQEAKQVHLKRISGNLPTEGTKQLYVHLEGFVLVAGGRCRVIMPTGRWADFEIEKTLPQGPVIVSRVTELILPPVKKKRTKPATYEDIGGFGHEISRIRELVELPLCYPELFTILGIEAPKGILLYGPPGCGKTLIARAVAGETDAYFVSVNGPEIMRKFYGESEAYLRLIFEKAEKNAPAIIFIDELDAIAPHRMDTRGDVEKRVVAQLLTLLDGLKDRGSVIVVGATNIPDALDPALRRPGRFDREIAIGVPNRLGRKEILQIHSRRMPLADDVNLDKVAAITHGFVGADLAALCREAGMCALRRMMPQFDFSKEDISPAFQTELNVCMGDFENALGEVEPSALRETAVEIPQVSWEDVGGLEKAKELLVESIEWPLEYSEAYARMGTKPARGILLYGPPGTGKTLLARAIASKCGANFISVKGPELMSKYVGESEEAVREVFRKARQAGPCIIFFDEIDALLPQRGFLDNTGVSDRVVSQFLTELDGIEELKGVTVLGATNRIDILDPAVLRPGRFDLVIELELPDEAARKEIYAIHLRGKKTGENVDFSDLNRQSHGMSGAEIEAVCQRASLRALRRFVSRLKEGITEVDPCLNKEDFVITLQEVQTRKGGERS